MLFMMAGEYTVSQHPGEAVYEEQPAIDSDTIDNACDGTERLYLLLRTGRHVQQA
jgi:hypothetical protein